MSILSHLNIVDLSRGHCGAYAAMQLGEYGAKVIRPSVHMDTAQEEALYWNTQIISPDTDIASLLADADVVIAETEQGLMGFTQEDVRKEYPSLICAIIKEDAECGGVLAEAASGLMDMTGFPDGAPTLSGGNAAECFAGVSLSFAITAALRQREKVGKGSWISFSLYDTYFSILESHILFKELLDVSAVRCGSADPPTLVPYDIYRCKDGYFSVGLAGDAGWDRFCNAIGMPELYDDPRYCTNEKRCDNYDEMTTIFSQFCAQRTRKELQELFTAESVPNAPVLSAQEAAAHPQIISREMIREVSGENGPLILPCSPMKMSITRPVYKE